MDVAVTQWINAAAGRNAFLDALVIGITTVGVPLMVLGVVLQWWSGGNRKHLRHVAVVAGLACLGSLGLNQLILLFVHRPRPYDAGVSHLIIAPSADWSFPSDHATVGFAIAATFAALGEQRRAAVFLLIALLVSWSRVFVGTHYITDVLGGAVTGIGVAVVMPWLYPEGTRVDRWLTNLF